ncbi:MAG TPA: glutamine-synthetase adenylyltransferase, partial [Phenylobacterium sp.]|nr:glutamine-synthetase adenylyltransferase [Phenylobacterium sp.]
MNLGASLKPCGPVLDAKAAERARDIVAETVWSPTLEAAWPALAPVFGASPYLAGLARRDPERLDALLVSDPDARLADILARTAAVAELTPEAAQAPLRLLKQELHLLTAIADLGGAWDLDQVTGALTRFADAAVVSALACAARAEVEAGRLKALGEAAPVPGWFCIA